jgi:hypothetical protein
VTAVQEPEPPRTSRFRDLHIRTYEIELLISGALVFGLMNLPGRFEAALPWWLSRLDGVSANAVTYLIIYTAMLVYALLGTFILHLCLRGYWVALLGLESVWPVGWDMDRMKFGPYGRRRIGGYLDSLSASIERADDKASVVFAAGALLALIFLYSLLAVLVILAVASGVAATTGWPAPTVFFVGFGVLVVLSLGVPLIDRVLGTRIPADSRRGRVFDRLVDLALRCSPVRWIGPLQLVFQTHLGERRVTTALLVASSLLATVLVGGFVWRADIVRLDGWTLYDAAQDAGSFDPRQYRNSGVASDGLRVSIDSDLITGPYVRVYLPYRPRRHNPLMATQCAEAVKAGTGRNAAVAQCLGGLHTVHLNGSVVEGLTYDFTRDAASDYVGVMTMVDVRTLGSGRHELVVEGPGRDEGTRATSRIPFYR